MFGSLYLLLPFGVAHFLAIHADRARSFWLKTYVGVVALQLVLYAFTPGAGRVGWEGWLAMALLIAVPLAALFLVVRQPPFLGRPLRSVAAGTLAYAAACLICVELIQALRSGPLVEG